MNRRPASGLRIEPLSKTHDRRGFSCGVPDLDDYLQKQASQDVKRKVATVFVAADLDGATIRGYFTLSMASIPLGDLPDEPARKLPLYPTVPAVRLGRLAVRQADKGQGLGTHLLLDALHRAVANEIAWAVFLVDAKDENARRFYLSFGFQSFQDDPNHLFLVRRTIEQSFGRPAAEG